MRRLTAVVAGAVVLLLGPPASPASRGGYEPDDPVPPGSKFETRDLRFRTEPFAGAVRGAEGTVKGLAVKETETEIKIELAADVLFDFDKAEIRPDAAEALKQAAEILQRYPKGRALVEGHTDAKGTAAYNQRLSERRAQAVKQWLEEREGVKGIALDTKGWGATRPVAPNTKPDGSDDPEGRQKNRRVEITVTKTPR